METALGRGFLAVVPPDAVLDAIETRVAPVRAAHDGLRWSRREQWHLTLRFLGPVPDVDTLVGAATDALASVPRIDGVQVGGAGAFPNERRASVLWVGVRAGTDALTRLATVVEAAAVACGFAPEPRPFAAHLTIARLPRPRAVQAVVEMLGVATVGQPWTVDEVVLISSDTRPTGAVHSEVARLPLARRSERERGGYPAE